MLEELAKLVPTIAQAILNSGSGGIIALLAVIFAGICWWDNRTLRQRIDDIQEKRLEESKLLVQLTERFTATMQDALGALYKKGR